VGLSPEYREYILSEGWRKRSLLIRHCTLNRDALMPLLKANHADHLTYRNMESELFLRDCVPLNFATHWVVTQLRKILRWAIGRNLANTIVAWVMRIICVAWLPVIYLAYIASRFLMWKTITALLVGILIGAANPEAVISLRNTIIRSSINQLQKADDHAARNQIPVNGNSTGHRPVQQLQQPDRPRLDR
jgi:hypothetical protein